MSLAGSGYPRGGRAGETPCASGATAGLIRIKVAAGRGQFLLWASV